MKTILLEIINDDKSCNKSATRYLYKTQPNLWKKVVEATDFLPATALAKQRVWHIINEVYENPVCPITSLPLKWHENDYFKTANRTAKQLLAHKNGKFVNGHTAESNEKRRAGNLKAVATGRKYRSKETYTDEIKAKAKNTFLEKYGVDNPSKHPDVRKKISDKHIENGATPKHLRRARDLYYEQVRYYTKQSWKLHFDKINPSRLNRSGYDLDHVYSQQQGFRDGIPPYIIGHWTNLQMLDKSTNYSKGLRCDKTQGQLFDDCFNPVTG